MNRIKKVISIMALIFIFLLVGCGKNAAPTSQSSNPQSQNIQVEENKKVQDKSNEIKANDKSQEIKIEDKVNKYKQKENNKAEFTKENKEIIKSEKKDNSKKNNATNKNEIVKKSNNSTFTLIIAKDLKGYTGKNPKILVKKQISILGDKNGMTYIRENSDMRDKGGFIYEINGVHNIYPIPASKKTPEQKKLGILGVDWFIYLNGKKTSVGANDVYPKAGDELVLDFHEWDKRELSPDAY